MGKRKIYLIGVMFMLFYILGGCWDARELEEQFLVWGMAWDVAKDDPSYLTLSLSSPVTEENAEENQMVISSTGRSVEEARMNVQVNLYRTIELGHMRILVVGEEFAKLGIQKFMDSLGRNPRIGRNISIAVVEGRGQDIWEIKNPANPLTADYIVSLIESNSLVSGAVDVTFRDFFECLSTEGKEPITSYLRISKDKKTVSAYSLAVFKKDKFVGTIDDTGVQAYLLIMGETKNGSFTVGQAFKTEENSTTFAYRKGGRKIKIKLIDGIPYIYLDVKVEGDIKEYTSNESTNNKKTIAKIENALAANLHDEIVKVIHQTQDYGSDVFGFGEYFRVYYPGYWNTHNWLEEYPKAVIQVNVKTIVRRIGIES